MLKAEFNEYKSSISRNAAISQIKTKYASNLDADNYITTKFVYSYNCARSISKEDIAIWNNPRNQFSDITGRLTFPISLWEKVNGYDETFTGYGHEDVNFATRLSKYIPVMSLASENYKSIPHEDEYRGIFTSNFIKMWRESGLTTHEMILTYPQFTEEDIPGNQNKKKEGGTWKRKKPKIQRLV